MKLAITGASGKTGFRVAEEALSAGYEVRLITRKESKIPDSIKVVKGTNYQIQMGSHLTTR